MDYVVTALISLLLGAALVWVFRRKGGGGAADVTVHSSIENIRSVGELVVFRMVTKEIVTAADHTFGETGKRYLSWLFTEKKMAMVFQFGIDFKFNLQSPDFAIVDRGNGAYRLRMPDCMYTTNILDISFYDEQRAKLLPSVLPDLLNQVFSGGFDQDEKNQLKDAAKGEANRLAEEMVERMQSEVHDSARRTLGVLAQGFGATDVTFEFPHPQPVLARIDMTDKAEKQITGEAV